MTQLAAASGWAMQRVFLTASLPPYLEKKLLRLCHLDPKHTLIIRGSTVRPELAHHLLIVPPSKNRSAQHVLIDLVRALSTTLKKKERMIVFVPSVPEAEQLSRILHSAIHHSWLPEVANTQAMNIDMWLTGEKPCIVATPGLIQGIHYPHTRYVVFLQFAYGMMSYFQGSGRGGRNGDRADVFLVRDTVVQISMDRFANKPKYQTDVTALHDMFHYVTKHTTCRQLLITQCMDGKGISCEDIPSAQKCDVCDPHGVIAQIGQCAIAGPPLIPSSLISNHTVFGTQSSERPEVILVPATSDVELLDQQATLPQGISQAHVSNGSDSVVPLKRPLGYVSSDDEFGYESIDLEAVDRIEWEALNGPTTPSGPGISKFARTANSSDPAATALSVSRQRSNTNPSLGLSILRGVEQVNRSKAKRLATTSLLNEILGYLGQKCPVCWAFKGLCIDHHRPFTGCATHGTMDSVPWAMGWIAFKRQIKFPIDFSYCWNCGLPMERRFNGEEPELHRQWSATARRGGSSPATRAPVVCPFADLVVLVVWVVFNDTELRAAASAHFRFPSDISLNDFLIWVQLEEPEKGQYWMGVEILVWLYLKWKNAHLRDGPA